MGGDILTAILAAALVFLMPSVVQHRKVLLGNDNTQKGTMSRMNRTAVNKAPKPDALGTSRVRYWGSGGSGLLHHTRAPTRLTPSYPSHKRPLFNQPPQSTVSYGNSWQFHSTKAPIRMMLSHQRPLSKEPQSSYGNSWQYHSTKAPIRPMPSPPPVLYTQPLLSHPTSKPLAQYGINGINRPMKTGKLFFNADK